MPEICRFFGIVISMYYAEHDPPHFHARYNGFKAAIRIRDLALADGMLPSRAMGLVLEWAALHQEELLADWDLARSHQTLLKIAPLE